MLQIPDLSQLEVSLIKPYLPSRQRTRVSYALHSNGYNNLAQLCGATENDLLRLNNMGMTSVKSVDLALNKIGLRLRAKFDY